MQSTTLNIDPTPDNFTGLTLTFDRAAALRKIHGRLAFTYCTSITANEGRGRPSPGNLKHPDEIVNILAFIMPTPANIVQCGGRIQSHGCPDAVRDEASTPAPSSTSLKCG